MATIYVRKALDKNHVKAIKNRNLTIEQLDNYYNQLIKEKKSAPLDFAISSIICGLALFFTARSLLVDSRDYLYLLLIMAPIILFLIYDFFYLRINQFKSAVKKGYPELKDRYR